jgi:phage terminase large subunit
VTTVQLELPPKLVELFTAPNKRFRGAKGGRGSAKTRSFAKMTAVKALTFAQAGVSGIILCGREFMNSLADSSMSEVKAAIESEPWLAAHFDIGENYIRTKDKRVEYAFIGLRHNLNSIKSKARILLAWIDEAEPVTEMAWQKLIPTVREDDSEIWLTWNPEDEQAATNLRFFTAKDEDTMIVEMNWRDNPWFPAVLERERQRDYADRPDSYEHIWEGKFRTIVDGAYYAKALIAARAEGRIGQVAKDPLMTIRAFWDIGGTGLRADATSIVIGQFVGTQIRVLDYYEAVGQPLASHVNWMRERGYKTALCVLPHDGANAEKVYSVTYDSALREAGFDTVVIPNQGRGAARMRIEAMRRIFPSIHFNEATTGGLLKALGWYHEKIDPERRIGLGPEHDWASHGADAAGLMAITYETPTEVQMPNLDMDWAS